MRLIYIYSGSYPNGMAMSKRLHLYAKGLQQQKIEQYIIVQHPGVNDSFGEGKYENIKYFHIKKPFRKSKNRLIKKLSFNLSYVLLLYKYLKIAKQYDLCWYVGHSWLFMLFLRLATYLFRKKLILELNEYPYVTIGDRRLNIKHLAKFNQFITLNIAYKFVDGFVVISRELEQLITNNSNLNGLVIKIPILIDKLNTLKKEPNSNIDRWQNQYLFHAGTLNEQKDGIVEVFKAFAIVAKKNPELKFILTNRTTIPSTIDKIENIIKENKIVNQVIFLNHITNSEVESHLRNCTLAILNKPDNKQNRYNFSTKLGEYLAYGVPLVTTAIGDSRLYLKNKVNCFIVEPNSTMQIAEIIKYIISHKKQVLEITNKGKEMAYDHFDYRMHSNELFLFLKKIISK